MRYFLLLMVLLILIYGAKKVLIFTLMAGAIIIGVPIIIITALLFYLIFNKKVKFYKYTNYNQNGNGYYNDWNRVFNTTKYQENISEYYRELETVENATDEEIKKAHRNMVKRYHPDIHAHKGEYERQESEIKLKKINEAYEKIRSYRESNVK